MLDKLFVNDETNALKLDKEVVAQGKRKCETAQRTLVAEITFSGS